MRISIIFTTFAVAIWVSLQNRVQRYNKKMKNTNYLVKKHQSYLVLLFALLVSVSIQAGSKAQIQHYIGAFANGGEWTMLPDSSAYDGSLGGIGGAGALYELRVGSAGSKAQFLLNVGLGVAGGKTRFSQNGTYLDSIPNQPDQEEAFGYPEGGDESLYLLDYFYKVKNRRDQYKTLALQIPIMIGVQYQRLYALAGAKAYVHLLPKNHYADALVTTYGRHHAIESFKFDDNRMQFFTDREIQNNNSNVLQMIDVDLSLELGYRFGVVTNATGFDVPKRNIEYRLALFADYGLMDIRSKKNAGKPLELPEAYTIDPTGETNPMVDYPNLTMRDIMSTDGFAKNAVNNLVVGVKFSVLFHIPEPGACVICRDAYKKLAPRRTSRRGMQYEE